MFILSSRHTHTASNSEKQDTIIHSYELLLIVVFIVVVQLHAREIVDDYDYNVVKDKILIGSCHIWEGGGLKFYKKGKVLETHIKNNFCWFC